ncbi:hypothetical protein amrb99_51660 [Actinomadura sp. RB99]|uniref:MerR family transcriptional regulator n=1 Tax=Actinomadura sp. RB99 TaxID=2691577 RepID=UPI0016834972|nr:MerR family transcriptional regulator [Actinomadura sp. RB99]MBD2896222.1 hypothetical protein [Actinomadura sp. RB99]
MTLVVADYPRKRFGKVAEINGITSDDGPWVSVREAGDITGLKSGVLLRWEEEGLISVAQAAERAQRRYLKQELEIVAKLGTDGPPTLRTLRHYIETRPGTEDEGDLTASPAATESREEDAPGPDVSEGAVQLAGLANLLRGQKLTAAMVDESRIRVTRDAGSRGVAIECRRRASDSDRWWFSWGGGVWLCEADNPTEAVVQVKAALRTIGAP